jgi:hypothetical protein
MKLSLRPVEIPFMIGDTVWVDQFCGDTNQYPYFQAQIIQIILDGSLANSVVIRQRHEVHDIVVSSGIYDLKPSGVQKGLPRVTLTIGFLEPQVTLFETEADLLSHRMGKN